MDAHDTSPSPEGGAASSDDAMAEPVSPGLPPLSSMGLSFARSMGRAVGALVTGRSPLVSEDIAQARARICRMGPCGRYLQASDRCSACGCYVSAKVRLATETCPLGLWGRDGAEALIDIDLPVTREVDDADEPSSPELSESTASEPEEGPPDEEPEPVAFADRDEVVPAMDAAIEPKGVTVVAYVSPRMCGACEALLEVFTNVGPSHPDVAFCVVDLDVQPLLGAKYNLEAVPTLLFYRDGGFVARLAGYQTESELAQTIGAVLEGLPVKEPVRSDPPASAKAEPNVGRPSFGRAPTAAASPPSLQGTSIAATASTAPRDHRPESRPPEATSLEVAQSLSELAWLRGSTGHPSSAR